MAFSPEYRIQNLEQEAGSVSARILELTRDVKELDLDDEAQLKALQEKALEVIRQEESLTPEEKASLLVKTMIRQEIDRRTDDLTGLWNLESFRKMAEHQLKESKKNDVPLAYMFFDIIAFKKFNDENGNSYGDLYIQAVGKALKEVEDKNMNAVASRLGGEEFALVLPGYSYEDCVELSAHLEEALDKTEILYTDPSKPDEPARPLKIDGFHVGIATSTPSNDGETVLDLQNKANQELKGRKEAYYQLHPEYRRRQHDRTGGTSTLTIPPTEYFTLESPHQDTES